MQAYEVLGTKQIFHFRSKLRGIEPKILLYSLTPFLLVNGIASYNSGDK